MKKHVGILLCLTSILSLAGCAEQSDTNAVFEATILEIHDSYYLVEPAEGSQELKSADQITVSMKNLDPSLEPEIGDTIKIEYNGEIAESYPAQITEVYSIKVVKEADKGAAVSTEEAIQKIQQQDNWGLALSVKDVTSTGTTLVFTQKGGVPTGELQTGGWYIVENRTKEDGWKEMPRYCEICWADEADLIPKEECTEFTVNWEELYGKLPAGQYRIGKEVMDFRDTGDYDKAMYYGEFEIR